MEKDDICITMGKNLKKLLDDYNISHEIFEGLTGINEERLNEIINAEGEELTVSEVYLMCNKRIHPDEEHFKKWDSLIISTDAALVKAELKIKAIEDTMRHFQMI